MNNILNEPLRLLIAEDMEEVAERLKLSITRKLGAVEIRIEKLDDALSIVRDRSFAYDVVVLDIFQGNPTDNDRQGEKTWKEFQDQERKLVPIIIYTAGGCELEPEIPKGNPLIKCFKKQSGSDEQVAEYLRSIVNYIQALRHVEFEFNRAIHNVIKNVSPLIWQAETDNQLRQELLVRSARRRLAAMMDMKTLSTGEPLLSWEQYIYPAIDDSLLTGDILRMKDGKFDDPAAYRLVLTPSCDLAMRNGKCKVKSVLVAKCKSKDEYRRVVASQMNVKLKDLDKIPDWEKILKSRVTEPQLGGYILLPGYKSILPSMTAYLRDLELIPITEISLSDKIEIGFSRITSIDSPFREQITWAYLQIAGRPGVPDRDMEKWTQEILDKSASSAKV